MGFETSISLHGTGGQLCQMKPQDFTRGSGSSGAARGPLLPPNSPNLYAHFDAIHLYGLHLEVNTWGKEESKR